MDQVRSVLEELGRTAILRLEGNGIALEGEAKLNALAEQLGG
jgi:hypothetical protein